MKIQEIAKLAGVSTATVSRVFSHHPSIRPEVREHVFAVARQYGYHPRLSTRQRNVVILTPYHSVYPVQSCVDMILMALTQELPRRNFRLEILPVNNRERLDSIRDRRGTGRLPRLAGPVPGAAGPHGPRGDGQSRRSVFRPFR